LVTILPDKSITASAGVNLAHTSATLQPAFRSEFGQAGLVPTILPPRPDSGQVESSPGLPKRNNPYCFAEFEAVRVDLGWPGLSPPEPARAALQRNQEY
jgi:hypothetical protein